MRNLDVNPCEEIDLLVKYLGQESSKYALNIRSANCNNPTIGLARLWDRLDERYGRPELIDASLRLKIDNFPKLTNRETKRLYELSDILSEIEAIKENPRYQQTFAFYDSSSGILPIIRKLLQPLQDKWTTHAVRYKDEHNVSFPPFSCFVAFIRKMSRIKNDPSFHYESSQSNELSFRDSKISRRFANDNKTKIHGNKTDLKSSFDSKEVGFSCPFHRSSKHNISECRGFKVQSIEERRKFLKENGICFLCCESSRHKKKDCNKAVTCNDCGSTSHSSALHVDSESIPSKNYGGEQSSTGRDHITNKCTQVCSKPFNGKSCSKTVLVKVYKKGNPAGALRVYAILDEQSNRSLASTSLFNVLDIRGQPSEYHLTSCAGTIKSYGRRASNIVIESLDGQSTIEVPTLVECELPSIRDEIPTPADALYHPHLSHIASEIPEIDNEAQILLLIGRDVPEAHHIHHQITGPIGAPYAQRVSFGWVVVGETCLKNFHPPNSVVVNKTFVLQNGRSSICKPCPNKFDISELKSDDTDVQDMSMDESRSGIFERNEHDDKIGPSIEDKGKWPTLFIEVTMASG